MAYRNGRKNHEIRRDRGEGIWQPQPALLFMYVAHNDIVKKFGGDVSCRRVDNVERTK